MKLILLWELWNTPAYNQWQTESWKDLSIVRELPVEFLGNPTLRFGLLKFGEKLEFHSIIQLLQGSAFHPPLVQSLEASAVPTAAQAHNSTQLWILPMNSLQKLAQASAQLS